MGEIFYFTVFALIIWRLVNLFVYEDGPFEVFRKFRNFLGIDESGGHQEGYFRGLFSCEACLSVMMALIFWPFFLYNPQLFILLLGWLGISTLVLIIYSIREG